MLTLSDEVDECKALDHGIAAARTGGGGVAHFGTRGAGRGSHSLTPQLNFSAFRGIGVRVGVVYPVLNPVSASPVTLKALI